MSIGVSTEYQIAALFYLSLMFLIGFIPGFYLVFILISKIRKKYLFSINSLYYFRNNNWTK